MKNLSISKMSEPVKPAWKLIVVSLALAGAVWLVFGQTLGHQFVNFDDGAYVYRNSQVTKGITLSGIKWAFAHVVAANWHPLTLLSHMLDCSLFGTRPAGHHFTNVILHTLVVILLFLLLYWMTRALWKSAFVAAIFAIHPLHVESVAWIAERKDTLSALLFLLAIAAYIHYARHPNFLRYAAVALLFALGLMAKAMLVTLPFVLLLLDYWPLRRMSANKERGNANGSTIAKLVAEKIPLLVLSAAGSVATLISQEKSINVIKELSLWERVANAFASVMIYVRQSFWPSNLAVFYPHPERNLPLWEIIAAVVFFVAVSAGVVAFRKRLPFLFVGWFWFVGMLVPVIGIIQVGIQAHADRYVYLPQIGLGIFVAWGATNLLDGLAYRRAILGIAAVASIAIMIWCAWVQTTYWRDSVSLWEHALAVVPDNELAREHLADAYLDKDLLDDAIAQAKQAVRLRPDSADARGVLGAALVRKGRLDEALGQLQAALELNPKLARVHYNLGNVFLQQGEVEEAIRNYEAELRIQPDFPEGHNNLANALFRKGESEAAFDHLQIALQLRPSYAEARNNFGIALSQRGEIRDAIGQWNKTLEFDSNNLDAACNLTWIFSTFPDPTIRNGAKAVELARRAIELSDGKNPKIWRLAAVAYAEAGRFPEAIEAAKNGLALAESQGNAALAETLEQNIRLFEQGSALRDLNAATPRR